MFRLAVNGAEVSVSNVVHELAPAGLRWNTTWTASARRAVDSGSVPEAFAPGSLIETAGALLSIVTVRTPARRLLPATSVTTTWSSASPSGQPTVFRIVEYGSVESLPTVVKPDSPRALSLN